MADENLIPDPQNARRHPDRNRSIIRQSLEEVGPFRSIAVDGDNVIRAGNGVYEQAQELGLKVRVIEAAPDELIAVKRNDLRGEQAERAALYDNQAGDLSEWDAEVLSMLAEDRPMMLEGIFDGAEVEALIEESEQMQSAERDVRSRDADDNRSERMGDEKAKIRPVIYAKELAVFEQAIRRTGIKRRGEALIEVCRYYLEHNYGDQEEAEGQHDPAAED
jgi:hypothetical protein